MAHDLIKDGARLTQSADDILEELNLHEIEVVSGEEKELIDGKILKKTKSYIYNSLTEDERKVYKILDDEPLYIDDVVKESKLGLSKVTKIILGLEIKKLIKELPGKQFIRK